MDWPAVVPNPNPWPGIEAGDSQNPYTDAAASQWPEQAISLAEAGVVITTSCRREKQPGKLLQRQSRRFHCAGSEYF